MKTRAAKPEDKSIQYRAGTIESIRAEGDKPAQIRMSVSSEAPVLTYLMFNDQYQRCYEILDHSPKSVDMSRCKDGLVVLDKHYGDQIGLMRCSVEAKKLGGTVEFCTGARAQEISQDAAKGLRRNVSVGYRVDPASYRNEGMQDGIPVVRAMSWMPYEASFEPIPADTTVGVGRAEQIENATATPAPAQTATVTAKERVMDPKEMAKLFARASEHGIDAARVSDLMADPASASAKLDALIVEKQRVEITELKARKPAAMPAAPPPVPLGGDTATQAKIVKRYSLANVCRKLMGDDVDTGFELEVSQEARRGASQGAQSGKFTVPYAVLAKRETSLLESTSTATVNDTLLAGEFIDVLRPYSILPALGVQFMSGLVGNVTIPKMTAAGSGYWVAEAVDITRLAPTLGTVTLQIHTCGAASDISWLMRMQSTPSAEQMVRDDIMKSVATKIEVAFFQDGGAGAPTRISQATGMNNPTVTGGTPTYAQILAFPGDIMADGAQAAGQKWAISAATWAKLAATYNDGTTKSYPVLDTVTKTIIGFPYEVSENVGTNAAFFGDFSRVIVGSWGNGIELNTDTATLSLAGGVRIVGLQGVDFAVRHGQALAYSTSVAA
jgi:HK97 family phage major capsid protein